MQASTAPSAFELPGGRRAGLWCVAGALALTALAQATGVAGALDGLAYDATAARTARVPRESARVLAIQIRSARGEPHEAELLNFLRLAGAARVAGVAFTFLPERVSAGFYRQAPALCRVLFGRPLLQESGEADAAGASGAHASGVRLAPWPAAAAAAAATHPDAGSGSGSNGSGAPHEPLAAVALALAPSADGILRRHPGHVRVGTEWVPTLELAAAGAEAAWSPDPGDAPYLVDLRGRASGVPWIGFEEVGARGLVPELAAGRWLLLGYAPEDGGAGAVRTAVVDAGGAPLLAFRGLALDALLTGRRVRAAGALAALGLCALCALFVLPLHARPGFGPAAAAAVGVVGLSLAAGAAGLAVGGFWPPVAELGLSQGALLLATTAAKAALARRACRRLLLDLPAERREPTGAAAGSDAAPGAEAVPDAGHEPWALVATFMSSTHDTDRSVFLECSAREHRLTATRLVNCSAEEILETLRDDRCPPYSLALERGGPVRVADFFRPSGRPEVQYLTPLVCTGQTLGFWAFAIDPARIGESPEFERTVARFGGEAGKFLDTRRRSQHRGLGGGGWGETFALAAAAGPYRELERGLSVQQSHRRQLEGLLDEAHTAAIVYDLFGRTLAVNSRMVQLLAERNFAPRERTIVDLLMVVTGQSAAAARQIVRLVVLDRAPITLPVAISGAGRTHLFSVRALELKGAPAEGEDLSLFSVIGLACELQDTTASNRLSEIKGLLTQKLSAQLRNHLAAIELAASMAARERVTPERRASALGMVHARVKDTVAVLTECEQYLRQDGAAPAAELFPLDPQPALARALEELRPTARSRGIEFEVVQPGIMANVLASPAHFPEVLLFILRLLLQDAVDGGKVRLTVEESEKTVSWVFTNTGCGLPNERFREYLFGDLAGASEAVLSLRKVIKRVADWGGSLEAESNVGVGLRARLQLRRFL